VRLLRGIASLVLILAAAAACSASPASSASDGAPDGADGIAPLMTAGDAPDLPDATTENTDCGSAADTVRKHVESDKIQSVAVVGQCTLVVIETSLDDEDGATARQICESAAEVAYTGDINAIAVKSDGGAELSQGITGMRCLP
jgi:hypothetical protein